MAVFSPFILLKPILLVAGLAAVGMGGYNLTTTGCPLGTCSASRAQSTQAAVSTTSDSSSASAVMSQGCARHMVSTPVADTDTVGDASRMDGPGCDMGSMDGMSSMGCDMAPGAAMVNMQADSACSPGNSSDTAMADCPMGNTADASYEHCQGGDGADCPYNTTNTTDTADDMATVPSDSTAQTPQAAGSADTEG